MTYKDAVDLCKNNPEVAAHIIITIEKLEQRIKELVQKTHQTGHP